MTTKQSTEYNRVLGLSCRPNATEVQDQVVHKKTVKDNKSAMKDKDRTSEKTQRKNNGVVF